MCFKIKTVTTGRFETDIVMSLNEVFFCDVNELPKHQTKKLAIGDVIESLMFGYVI